MAAAERRHKNVGMRVIRAIPFAAASKAREGGLEMTAARWLAVLPFLGILVGVAFVNQVEPLVFGLPFVLAWIVGWIVAGAGLTAIIYALDPANAETGAEEEGGRR